MKVVGVGMALLLAGLLAVGCAKKKDAAAEKQSKAVATANALREQLHAEGVPKLEGGEIPGSAPVWPAGTTFNKETRDATVVARTQALDAYFRRAKKVYGDSLKGQLTLKFPIYPDGTIGPIRVIDEKWNVPHSSAITDSMISRVQQWTFPPGLDHPITFTQPWKFGE